MPLSLPTIGVRLVDPLRADPWIRSVLAFLESGLGARLRLLDGDDPPPERLLVIGARGRVTPPPEPRIVLFLPPIVTGDPHHRRRDWIEPGPIPVFGPVERFQASGGLPWRYLGGGVPVNWCSRKTQTLLILGFDPLGPVARALSRADERGEEGAAWRHARMLALPATARHLALTPWVDRTLRLLHTLLDLGPSEERPGSLARWPGRARWAAGLSHDVDMLFKWRLRSVLRLLLESPLHLLDHRRRMLARRWGELIERLQHGRDPWFLVDELMDLEERHGLHSSLLFLAEPRDHQTFRYHLGRAQVRGLLARARQRAFEVSLHGGWSSHQSGQVLDAQRRSLESWSGASSPVVRQHWLRFIIDGTWQAQEEAGLQVDSSLGFNDRPGFRAGTSLPFHPLDGRGRTRPLLELPLILMDSQLFDEQGLAAEQATRQAMDALEQTRRVRGLFTLNWHPHTLCEADFPGRRHLFERLLERVGAPDCWAAGLGEVAAHWRRREALLRDGTSMEAGGRATALDGRAPCAC